MTDPVPTYTYLVSQLSTLHPSLAYIHVVEPELNSKHSMKAFPACEQSNDFIRAIWGNRPLISCGDYTRSSGIKTADEKGDLIAYGRPFVSNVKSIDLPSLYIALTFFRLCCRSYAYCSRSLIYLFDLKKTCP